MASCDYSSPLESIGKIPVPDKGESAYNYAKQLQDKFVEVQAINLRNIETRQSTADCIDKILK